MLWKLKKSEYKIRKIMKKNGLYPELVKKFKLYPNKKSDGTYSENLLKQKFHAEKLMIDFCGKNKSYHFRLLYLI